MDKVAKDRKVTCLGLVLLLTLALYCTFNTPSSSHHELHKRLFVEPNYNTIDPISSILRNLMNDKIRFLTGGSENTLEPANQGVEVSYPYVPNPSYGSPVYSGLLLQHTFGNSYLTPALETFTPPSGVKFNKVVLTLNTSVGDYQYDRLAHIFVGGVEIWRTSTIEPNGGVRFSIFSKDVTPYTSLFQKETTVLFLLGNVVSASLRGEFAILVTIDLYDSDVPALQSDDDTGVQEAVSLTGVYDIFSVAKPADKVYPLVGQANPSTLPLITLPQQSFNVKLPTISSNTTRLRLSLFTSGMGNEEFWYTNVLNRYANIYPNSTMLDHGPTRFINVYFNNKRIITQTPHPVIFTGGISPEFWMPIVSNNAFDLKSYDVDVSALLPYLWESSNSTSNSLRVEISNGFDGEVGKDWGTSAALLGFESDNVVKSSGSVSFGDQETVSNTMGSYENDTFAQVANVKLGTEFGGNLAFELKSGLRISTSFKHVTHGLISNVQTFVNQGNVQYVAHVGHNHRHLSILASNVEIFLLDSSVSFPFFNLYNQTSSGYPMITDTEVINIKDTAVTVNGIKSLDVSVSQYALDKETQNNKTSRHTVSNSHTEYNLQSWYPVFSDYSRKVVGNNESVVSDQLGSSAGGFVDIANFDLADTGSYDATKKFITESFHGEYSEYLDPIFESIELSNIPAGLSSSHEKRFVTLRGTKWEVKDRLLR